MRILVTGGAGYIGSHTCLELIRAGHEVIIADNLVNSKKTTVDRIIKLTGENIEFYQIDVTNENDVDIIFQAHKFDGVIHFAGMKAVGESVRNPLMYYHNNLGSTITLANSCLKHGVNKFVFSSSATVYGDNSVPFHEEMNLLPPTSPYGQTKVMCEQILSDAVRANGDFSITLL